MSKRYSDFKMLDKCLSPIKIFHGEKSFIVPCGKCDACRLNRANDWSMRLGAEISSSRFTIWFTLTYDNKYVPTLQKKLVNDKVVYYSDHSKNIRFNGKTDVLRTDGIEIISGAEMYMPVVTNLYDDSRTTYLSKRDIQLFYKNVRKLIYETFKGSSGFYQDSIRYYCIGEYGSTKLRAHSHHLIFTDSKEVKDLLVSGALYSCWQMCDKTLFDKYCSLTGDGVRNYVTNYVTSFSKLPSIYQDPSVRPFRLSSKSPSIGYCGFDEEKILEDVLQGTIYYSVTVPRIERKYFLRYPKSYISRLFPKCWRFSEKPYHLLLSTYGLLWFYVVKRGFSYDTVLSRLRQYRNPLDYYATKRCYEVCIRYNWHPHTFLWYLDRVYYLYDIDTLGKWYQWQEEKAKAGKKEEIIYSYTNLGEYCRKPSLSEYEQNALYNFLSSFGIAYDYFLVNYEYILDSFRNRKEFEFYRMDLEDILNNMDKSNRVKELAKVSPTNNPLIY